MPWSVLTAAFRGNDKTHASLLQAEIHQIQAEQATGSQDT